MLAVAPRLARAGDDDRQLRDVGPMTELKAMMLKYVARCALDGSQSLIADPGSPAGGSGAGGQSSAARPPGRFPGLLGLAPEWLAGTCTNDCQERVSACLLALVNRSGKHVEVSMASAAPDLVARLGPNANDLDYPHQEGAFFGNVWANQTFSCRGTGVGKAAQSKRFCAAEPATCSVGAGGFVDSGTCADACQMRCFSVGANAERCAAVACRDPGGHLWEHPITVLLKNEIAAANADQVSSMTTSDQGLVPRAARASATFEGVDLGSDAVPVSRMWVRMLGAMPGAHFDVWLGDGRRLGGIVLEPSTPRDTRVEIPLTPAGRSGPARIVLRVRQGKRTGTIQSIELR
ncbi:MAG: hypothetical protein ABUS79_01730 [Pseudomonadota bacterium]